MTTPRSESYAGTLHTIEVCCTLLLDLRQKPSCDERIRAAISAVLMEEISSIVMLPGATGQQGEARLGPHDALTVCAKNEIATFTGLTVEASDEPETSGAIDPYGACIHAARQTSLGRIIEALFYEQGLREEAGDYHKQWGYFASKHGQLPPIILGDILMAELHALFDGTISYTKDGVRFETVVQRYIRGDNTAREGPSPRQDTP